MTLLQNVIAYTFATVAPLHQAPWKLALTYVERIASESTDLPQFINTLYKSAQTCKGDHQVK